MKRGRALGPGRTETHKRRNGPKYYKLVWRDASGRKRERVLGSNAEVAEKARAKIIRERDLEIAGLAEEEKDDPDLQDVIDAFLEDVETRTTPKTHRKYKDSLDNVFAVVNARTVSQVKAAALLKYRSNRKKGGATNCTANDELGVVRTMLNWAVQFDWVSKSPLKAPIEPLPQGKGFEKLERRPFSEEEGAAFLDMCREIDAEEGERVLAKRTIENATKGPGYADKKRIPRVPQAPFWKTLIEAGGRFGETAKLTWGFFSERDCTIRFRARTTKRKRERTLPLSPELTKEIASLRALHHEVHGRLPRSSDQIFLTPRGCSWVNANRNALRMFHEICIRAGITLRDDNDVKVDIHSLRYTFCTRMALNNVPLVLAQKAMGHADIRLTAEIYSVVQTDDLREALAKVPSLETADVNGRQSQGKRRQPKAGPDNEDQKLGG